MGATHVHSTYSRLDGLSTPKQIAERIKEINFEGCALTDHDVVAGHVEFYREMINAGLKPCLGIETYQALESRFDQEKKQKDEHGCKTDQFHLILLAQNDEGLRNLWRLNSESHRSGFYYHGRVDWDLLEKYNEGLICTSACASSLIGQLLQHDRPYEEALLRYLGIFKDRFRLEICTYAEQFQYDLNEKLVEIANEWSIPLVVSTDAHYAKQEDYELHEATLAVQFNDKLDEKDGFYHMPCLYIMDEKEIKDYLYYIPQIDEAIENSKEIVRNSNVTLPTYRNRVPIFIPEKHTDSWDMFFELVENGYQDKVVAKGLDQQIYFERLTSEMKVFREAELHNYFLIVRDYITWARRNKIIVGPGRGSVGGCLIAWLIDITEVDPIKYDLIFERFYNIGRGKHMPDIDTDFSTVGKDLVYGYIANKYGKNHVAHLGTNITLKGKGAVNDLGRVMGVPLSEVRKICEILDTTIDAGIQADWDQIEAKVGRQLEPYKNQYPQLFEWSKKLYEHLRSYGVHASGVIIGDKTLDSSFPLRWSTKEKELVTQWPMEIAEDFGYMKMDLLGLRNLDTLEELNKILIKRGKGAIDFDLVDDKDCPEEMWKLLDRGITTGVFQIEEGAQAKAMAQRMKPRSIEDLSMLLALNRPGPDSELYFKTREGKAVPFYENPVVESVTKETLGVWIFQEQLINFMVQIGYTLQEADNFRAIMGKKKVKEIAQAKGPFLDSCQNNGINISAAEKLWKKFEAFSKYGFNKAHSIAYAMIAFRTLYAIFFYPAEFFLACVHTVEKPRLPLYFSAFNRLGIEIYPPDINKSEVETVLDNHDIRFGLRDIKYIGKNTAQWIVDNAPFTSKQDLIDKSLEDSRKITLPSGIRKVAINSRQIDILYNIGAMDEIEDRKVGDKDDQILLEKELLGFSFSDDSATLLEKYLESRPHMKHLEEIEKIGQYVVAAVVDEIEYKKTKTGKNIGQTYARVKIRDLTGDINIFVWNNELNNLKLLWRRNLIGEFTLRKTDRGISLVTAKIINE